MRGTNATIVTSIRRDEPAASLFQVPSDYTVQEPAPRRLEQMRQFMRGTPPPPPQQ